MEPTPRPPSNKPRKLRKPRFLFLKYLFGLSALLMGAYSVYVYVDFERVAVRAPATVVDLRSETHAAGRRGGRVVITRPMVEFETGKAHVKALAKTTSRESDLKRGQTIEVAYDPANPDETVRLDTGLSMLEIGTLLFGLLVVGYAVKEQVDWRRDSKLFASAKAGMGVDAQVQVT